MKKFFPVILAAAVLLSGCTFPEWRYTAVSDTSSVSSAIEADENTGYPINYREQVGLWLPYTRFTEYMQDCTEEKFTDNIREILENAAADGINTIYFHAHPFGDAYYCSEIYPKGDLIGGDYDPLAIVTEIAHSLGISVHAWLNPYRMQTVEEMAELPDDFIIKKLISENDPAVRLVGERYYLDPGCDISTELVCRTAAEILDNYDVDGIHIDDYFYPDTDPGFDSDIFEKSDAADLGDWRRDNISGMVKALYDTVKSRSNDLKFGISPQGNISNDYDTLYADVKLWTGTEGYADYIVPQLYYGFKNSVCPFAETLGKWEELCKNSDVSLIIGLAGYKLGKYDKWAGAAGENEWIDDPDIISKQIELVKNSSADGYAIYS